jgi:hypothetical protein
MLPDDPIEYIQGRIQVMMEQLRCGNMKPEERRELAEFVARWRLRLADLLYGGMPYASSGVTNEP